MVNTLISQKRCKDSIIFMNDNYKWQIIVVNIAIFSLFQLFLR